MSDDPSDDYFEAAAAVVEAARKLDEARKKFKAMNDAVLGAHVERQKAEEELEAALERLKSANTGRTP